VHYSTVQIVAGYTKPIDAYMLSSRRWQRGVDDVCKHIYKHVSEKLINLLECIIDTIARDIPDAACLYGY
jgi:hypothetical protein